MGGGNAADRDGRVVPVLPDDERVIRDRRFKRWLGPDRSPTALDDLKADPWEEPNLIEFDEPEAVSARDRLLAVASTFPERDAASRYRPNLPQPWDRDPSRR
ncbi:hypothetical protein [Tautonia sociabilis]|uniref:N-sulphoglucosamine sulphohydrolase C-terminal domain-containing protein n=1 Tax=Tautonia sociabilis TaxID=2080755 RepID=A0A432MK78_9BACT|nr:hypothetical protein [Tautonia sociabilis]RUL87801.1 hypothetical protein TsocGM_10600 [Tautonia sociabilis]